MPGEFFLKLENKPQGQSMINSETGFADPMKGGGSNSNSSTAEKKMIPVLDIKQLETLDNLTFSIILHDDCLLNCYDVIDPSA